MIRDDFHPFFVFLLFNVVELQYKRNGKDMDENNVPDMRPTFEEIRKVDDNGKEYWSSRELCNAMGYSGYWKFQNVIDKAIKVASEKGMDIDDHFNHVVEMVKLGSGSFRKVEAFHLSRMACMIISENADSRKLLVKQARAYFSQFVSTTELMQNSLESNILLYKTAQGETRIEVIFNNETFWMSQKKWLHCLVLIEQLSLIIFLRFMSLVNCKERQLVEKFNKFNWRESVMLSVLHCSTILMLSLLLVIVVPSYLI